MILSLHETEQKRNQDYQMMTKYVGKKTALFFLADIFAVEAIHYFQEQGIRIPDDLGLPGLMEIYLKVLLSKINYGLSGCH